MRELGVETEKRSKADGKWFFCNETTSKNRKPEKMDPKSQNVIPYLDTEI
jgi:hypothetical protein